MKITQLAGTIVTSMVVVLIVVSVLIPVIQNNDTTSYVESDNEGELYRMAKSDATYSETVTITTVGSGSVTYTIGSTSKTISGSDTMLWLWDNGLVELTSTGIVAKTANVGAGGTKLTAEGDSLNFSGGTFKWTKFAGGERSSPYTWVIHPDTNGTLGAFDSDFNASKGATIYAVYVGSNGFDTIVGSGTVTNISQLIGASTETSTYTPDYTESSTYYTVSGCTIVLNNGSEKTVTANAFVAPITYTSSVEAGGDIVNVLLGIIPILIIVGVVMGVVGLYIRGRDY